MKTNYLLPNSLKKIGWVIIIISVACFLVHVFTDLDIMLKMPALSFNNEGSIFTVASTSIYDTILPVFALIGFIFIGFSKEKEEDEYVKKIREHSFVFATFFTSILLIICTLFLYFMDYFTVIILDYYVFLLIFALKFQIELWRFRKENRNEE